LLIDKDAFLNKRLRRMLTPEYKPITTMKISSRPRIIPNISTISVAAPAAGPVTPMDRPTIPNADANSNAPSVKPQLAVTVVSREPTMNRNRTEKQAQQPGQIEKSGLLCFCKK
jgi:hypothetical protein